MHQRFFSLIYQFELPKRIYQSHLKIGVNDYGIPAANGLRPEGDMFIMVTCFTHTVTVTSFVFAKRHSLWISEIIIRILTLSFY